MVLLVVLLDTPDEAAEGLVVFVFWARTALKLRKQARAQIWVYEGRIAALVGYGRAFSGNLNLSESS